MQLSFKSSGLVILLSALLFTACNNKKTEEPIIGKWQFREFIFETSPEHPTDPRSKTEKEEQDQEATGTIFLFNEDRTFSVIPGNKSKEIMTGTWDLKKNGRLIMIKNGESQAQTATASFPEKDLLKLEHATQNTTILFDRVK